MTIIRRKISKEINKKISTANKGSLVLLPLAVIINLVTITINITSVG